jgi:hypothetical protein
MINGKTEVRMIKDSGSRNMCKWTTGEIGYIDGYGGNGAIAVVIGKKLIMCDTWDFEVIDENTKLVEQITSGLTNHIGPR